MSYKNTLNLPHTDFSMKANLGILEPKILSVWKDLDIYQRLRNERKDKVKFILHDGPPYANGSIHIGHALNKILKDIVIKYKILQNYDCPFIVGWDCHGLPVEHQLFKELGITKHDIEISEFRKKAKEYALKFVDLQRDDFKRLGIFSNWKNPYLTLTPDYEYEVMNLLSCLVEKGYIYRGRKPVNWCGCCETALAEAEVEYLDKTSESIYFLFSLIDKKDIVSVPDATKIYFLAWTTTPWTIVSNVAVALHPQLDYSLAKFNNRLIILGTNLIPSLEEKFGAKFNVIKSYKGSDLEGLRLKHPFIERESAVVLGDFVSKEDGSGCVHIAPGHGEEDFSLTKKYSLDIIMPIDDRGIFESPDDFAGKNIKEANELVIKKLKDSELLLHHESLIHSYPHCWRCKKAIIFRATFQWFLNVDHKNLRNKLLEEVEKVRWIPNFGSDRMKSMLLTRPDWCLSRQRLWGVPIPAINCGSCSQVILDTKVISKAANIFKEKGSDSWFTLELKEFLPKEFTCPKCGSKNLSKEFDILDVWFESGASFLSVVKANKDLSFPSDLYLEGSDQHRGWFQVSLIPSVAKEGVAPFKSILTHGFVVDAEGKKMSKSLGNIIAPQKIIKQYGAEILRLWTACADYSEDVKISADIIKQLVDMYRKVRNTIRFILGNIADFNITNDCLPLDEMLEVDRFMAAKIMLLRKEAIECYENFSFYKVCQKIFNFCNIDLSSFYLDILKDRLYTFPSNSKERRSAQFVLYHILKVLLKLIAPILSFTAEEAYSAWENLADKKDSIFLSSLDEDGDNGWLDSKILARWEKILSLRTKVLKNIEEQRTAGIIGSSLEASVLLSFNDSEYEFYSKIQDVLREVLIVSSVLIENGDFSITVKKAEGNKCMRCWNWSEKIGESSEYPDICDKCSKTLTKEVL